MFSALVLNREAIVQACKRYGVARLRVFGSVLTERFDPERSDVDFLVDFWCDGTRPSHAHFGLKAELERIVGRDVDLVVADAVKNPYFATSVFAAAEELYAA